MITTLKTGIIAIFCLTLLSVVILQHIAKVPEIPIERVLKRDREIDGILDKSLPLKMCVQYALIASKRGIYPCYNGEVSTIYLKEGEVWKYGKTCNSEQGRYPNGLPAKNLQFIPQFLGTEEQCLIMEKEKIYAYIILPENIERARRTGRQPLMRPPGNRIDR